MLLRKRHNDSDAKLFEGFLRGDDDAFLELFRRHNNRLKLYCLKIVGDRDQAEDLTQEMWERTVELRRESPEVRNPVGMLLRIARNLCIDHLRKQRRLLSLTDLDESAIPTYTLREPSELEELAIASLDRLPFEYREVLVLNLYCGYRFDEIAVMLDKTSEAVWATASRARRKLRSMVLTAAAATTAPSEAPTSHADATTITLKAKDRNA